MILGRPPVVCLIELEDDAGVVELEDAGGGVELEEDSCPQPVP